MFGYKRHRELTAEIRRMSQMCDDTSRYTEATWDRIRDSGICWPQERQQFKDRLVASDNMIKSQKETIQSQEQEMEALRSRIRQLETTHIVYVPVPPAHPWPGPFDSNVYIQ